MNEEWSILPTEPSASEAIASEESVAEPEALPEEEILQIDAPTEEEEPSEEAQSEDAALVSVESLQKELAALREELAQAKALHARMDNELAEFRELFPAVSPTSLPDGIWEEVKRGIPLAASYALYEKKCAMEKTRAEEINLRNAYQSPGVAGKDTAAEYFTPEDVRVMSRAEVHNHYKKIMDSMKKWSR